MTKPETPNIIPCEIRLVYHYPWKWQVFINGVDQGDLARFNIDIERMRIDRDSRTEKGITQTYTITKEFNPAIE